MERIGLEVDAEAAAVREAGPTVRRRADPSFAEEVGTDGLAVVTAVSAVEVVAAQIDAFAEAVAESGLARHSRGATRAVRANVAQLADLSTGATVEVVGREIDALAVTVGEARLAGAR